MLYTSPWLGFELTTSVVIWTDCIGSCKSSHHTNHNGPEITGTCLFSVRWWFRDATNMLTVNALKRCLSNQYGQFPIKQVILYGQMIIFIQLFHLICYYIAIWSVNCYFHKSKNERHNFSRWKFSSYLPIVWINNQSADIQIYLAIICIIYLIISFLLLILTIILSTFSVMFLIYTLLHLILSNNNWSENLRICMHGFSL
jgi:hypothetical protein